MQRLQLVPSVSAVRLSPCPQPYHGCAGEAAPPPAVSPAQLSHVQGNTQVLSKRMGSCMKDGSIIFTNEFAQ